MRYIELARERKQDVLLIKAQGVQHKLIFDYVGRLHIFDEIGKLAFVGSEGKHFAGCIVRWGCQLFIIQIFLQPPPLSLLEAEVYLSRSKKIFFKYLGVDKKYYFRGEYGNFGPLTEQEAGKMCVDLYFYNHFG